MKRPVLLALLLAFTIIIININTSQAENLLNREPLKKHKSYVGFKFGFINQTDFRATGKTPEFVSESMRTKLGLTAGLFFDVPTNDWMMVSFAVDLVDVQIDAKRVELIDLSFTLKFPIYKEIANIAWRPLVGIGYGYLGEVEPFEKSSYTTIKAGLELVFYSEKKHAFIGEITAYGSPWGANDNFDITFGPVILARVGVIY